MPLPDTFRSFVAAALLAALLPGASPSALEPADEKDVLVERIDELVREQMKVPEAVGLSVAVAVAERIVLAKGYGLAEVEHGVRADAETVFRIGSITKQFTAAAIVRLYEQWKLDIDEDMTAYLPDYPTQGHTVTLRHLLTHTSGIQSYTGMGESFWRTASVDLTHDELLAGFEDEPFQFEPGAAFAYNNSGYYLLGMIIERVAQQSYADYVEAELFEPLGLTRTRYGSNADIIENRAQGYRIVEGELQNDQLISMNQPGAAGALISNARELVEWQLALVAGKVVEPESYAEMTMPFMLDDGSETTYGFGLVLGELDGRRLVQHGGGIHGFNSMLLHLPEEAISVAVISNCEQLSSQEVAIAIARLALETEPSPTPAAVAK